MKKSKAIKILNNQIKKLELSKEDPSHSWLIETKTYVESFFGKSSHQINYFNFHSWNTDPHKSKDEIVEETLEILKDYVNTINNIGVYKPESNGNYFTRLNATMISFWLGVVFSAGAILGRMLCTIG